MPKITIQEFDKTTSPNTPYENFTVVVPGFISPKLEDYSKFDANGICKVSSQKDFKDYIGLVPTTTYDVSIEETDADGNKTTKSTSISHYGNQIAWELLGLGYTVLYVGLKLDNSSTSLKQPQSLHTDKGWDCLADKAEYDFRYIVTGIIDNATKVSNCISKLANIRQDCTALIDIDSSIYDGKKQSEVLKDAATTLAKFDVNEYTAIFAPAVTYDMKVPTEYNVINGETSVPNTTFPASFHYLACAAKAFENYNEWYAVAGYTRGVSKYTIKSVGCTFGEAAIETFEPRNNTNVAKAVNLIVKIKNNYYLWGNRTAALLNDPNGTPNDLTAKHFLNIRQLCTTIKKQVYVACRRFTFDPNSDILWLNFCNAIKPTLEKMKADQGISDYKLIKVKAGKKAVLAAKIRIVPIEAVEDFDIKLFLEDDLKGSVIEEQ